MIARDNASSAHQQPNSCSVQASITAVTVPDESIRQIIVPGERRASPTLGGSEVFYKPCCGQCLIDFNFGRRRKPEPIQRLIVHFSPSFHPESCIILEDLSFENLLTSLPSIDLLLDAWHPRVSYHPGLLLSSGHRLSSPES